MGVTFEGSEMKGCEPLFFSFQVKELMKLYQCERSLGVFDDELCNLCRVGEAALVKKRVVALIKYLGYLDVFV